MSRLPPVLALVLATMSTASAENPPGALISDAVAVDVTDDGLRAFLPLVEGYVPESFAIPDLTGESATLYDDCGGFDTCWRYSVSNGAADLELMTPTLTPGNGVIDFETAIRVSLNGAADPLLLDAAGKQCIFGGCPSISQSCEIYVDPFDVPLSTAIQLDYNTFTSSINATILPLQYDLTDLTDNTDKVHIEDCGAGTLITILGYIGLDVTSLVLGQIVPILDAQVEGIIDDLNDQLEPLINDAVGAASISTSFEVLGTSLDVDIAPEDVQVTPDGVRILLGGSIDAPPDDCVAQYGIEGSLATPSTLDPVGVAPGGVSAPDIAVHADDDIVNQGLFAVWNSGLLCYTVDDTFEGLPLAINTDLLGLLAPTVFDELFPTSAPLVLRTRPQAPPTATLTGPNDLDIAVRELGLDFYAEVDGRLTRMIGVDLEADAGVNVGFDGTTGELGLDIDFDTSEIQAVVSVNEFRPEASQAIADSLLGIVDSLVGPALGDLLADQSFAIPGFEGYGLTSATVAPTAGAPDRLGVYGNVGAISYDGGCEGGGCDDAGGGCDDAACDSSSASGRLALFAVPLLLALFRRRES